MSPDRWLLRSCITALLAAGCASNPSPIPLNASPNAIASLAGEWSGEYSSTATGRSGSIVFTLTAGRDTAFGDVVMVPGAGTNVAGTGTAAGKPVVTYPASQPLRIRFVQVAGDSVSGVLEPYSVPDCGCVLTTTFTGRVASNRIDGTFTTSGDPQSSGPQNGRWTVKRRK
jgi:hypothetical protein